MWGEEARRRAVKRRRALESCGNEENRRAVTKRRGLKL